MPLYRACPLVEVITIDPSSVPLQLMVLYQEGGCNWSQ